MKAVCEGTINLQHMAINKEWHKKHKMPKNPGFEERMRWHIEHLKHCDCYPVSEKLREEIQQYRAQKRRLRN
jgi:hypothetical protein